MSHADEYVAASCCTLRTARKPHRCCACSERIAPGHRYERVWTVHDGEVAVYKRCLRCRAIWQAITRA